MKTHDDERHHGECQGSLRVRLLQSIVQPVPDGLALCVFDCEKTECTADEWAHCKRRLDALRSARD
jgi:hypothetical protein